MNRRVGHILCFVITVGVLACGLLFPYALGRLIESVRDFGLSVGYWFCEFCGIEHHITPTVITMPKIPFFSPSAPDTPPTPSLPLPTTWDGFKADWTAYWRLWADMDNFVAYCTGIGDMLYVVLIAALVLLPFILLLRVLLRRYLRTPNNNYDSDSKPLRVFKRLLFYLSPVKPWCISFFAFIRERRGYWLSWLLLWLFYFNAYTIVIEFFAFYFYFTAALDVGSIYRQIYKLFLDLSPAFMFIPLWVWGIVALVLLDRFRKAIAYNRLRHYEMYNRGFINARPLVAMVVGTMGKGKTTMLTDMCLSTEVMFRDKALEKLLENDLKFPHFPWLKFELTLRAAMACHEVYNLATCRRFVRLLRRFVPLCGGLDTASMKSIRRHLQYHRRTTVDFTALSLWSYDSDHYGLTYDDKLQTVNLWDVLETYAQLYFIYITQSSLLVANYSIRTDCLLSDLGNFPLWNTDFFRRDSRLIDSFSRHAHILDFDFLRLGKTVLKNNPHRHALEFGVVAVSEIGKERRNALELRERGVKLSDGDTNQKNDGFNDGLKMRRQAATVDNFAFLKIISDEQRPESFGADARDMFDVIHIDDRSDDGLAMPFFSLGELLYSFVLGRFQAFYTEYRFLRGDNTLLMFLVKSIASGIEHYYTRIHNRFNYNVLRVQVESGLLDGKYKDSKYFLCWKKIYSKRFATDCMSAFWEERALRSPVGLGDLREYKTAKATWDELKSQNSYFVRDLIESNLER